ncbi:methyltransferase domain-containing protein [Streptosporangium sp. NPDC051022]|uniref:methyltransferase domain-containing protein n=1 Tax=Streptosporangium sp. NPDC051022 TaxID=3155752 RepID=UPI0034462B97
MTVVRAGQQELRDLLLETGALSDDWVAAYEAVARELFLPEVIWPDDGRTVTVSKTDDPEEWRRWAYTNVPIATQWDDGHHTGTAPGTLASSSSSAPSVVFTMLAALSVADGAKVLEVGTGTGWCAALLSARLGESNVVSVEVDQAVAEVARKALADAGWHPQVVVGDGLLGWPDRAPYDRVLVTAGVREVPHTWIEQTRPGGVIVLPWGTRYSGQNAVVRLVVADDGTASGRFSGATRFMHVRSQRGTWPRHRDYLPGGGWPEGTRRSTTALTQDEVLSDDSYAAVEFVFGLLLPECVYTYGRSPRGTMTMWLYGLGDRSWAAAYFDEDDPAASRVYQGGPRSLWDEVEAAHRWWSEHGRPGHEEFGLTITADGRQQVWLGEPSALVPQAVPAR